MHTVLSTIADSLRRHRWQRAETMPLELRTAELLLSECPVWTYTPLPLHGVPDQVYEALNGDLIVVDTKARRAPRVYLSDIVQLSVYGVILRHTRFAPVASRTVRPYGYVRCRGNQSVHYVRAQLLSEADVIAFALRYLSTRRRPAA